MRRILICTGVLGGGTALVFGAAAVAAALIPPSSIVPQNPNVMFGRAMPGVMPVGPGNVVTIVDDAPAGVVVLPAPDQAP
jgi:hypothetical protein